MQKSINFVEEHTRWRARCVDTAHRWFDSFRWCSGDEIGQFLPVEFGELIAHMVEVEGEQPGVWQDVLQVCSSAMVM